MAMTLLLDLSSSQGDEWTAIKIAWIDQNSSHWGGLWPKGGRRMMAGRQWGTCAVLMNPFMVFLRRCPQRFNSRKTTCPWSVVETHHENSYAMRGGDIMISVGHNVLRVIGTSTNLASGKKNLARVKAG